MITCMLLGASLILLLLPPIPLPLARPFAWGIASWLPSCMPQAWSPLYRRVQNVEDGTTRVRRCAKTKCEDTRSNIGHTPKPERGLTQGRQDLNFPSQVSPAIPVPRPPAAVQRPSKSDMKLTKYTSLHPAQPELKCLLNPLANGLTSLFDVFFRTRLVRREIVPILVSCVRMCIWSGYWEECNPWRGPAILQNALPSLTKHYNLRHLGDHCEIGGLYRIVVIVGFGKRVHKSKEKRPPGSLGCKATVHGDGDGLLQVMITGQTSNAKPSRPLRGGWLNL
ncbi:hypothetical protein DFH06DRAFT_1296241 [Mycena polygramma]|nr:hypothetical protein DFH06DRAFT_1296241 [Mycena polygramma]